MKKIHCFFSLLIALLFFSSCQKPIVFVEGSGPGGTIPNFNSSSMSAKVNGVLVTCEFAYAQSYTQAGKLNMQLNGFKNPQAFVITWQDFKGVGTYNAADIISSANYVAGITDPLTQGYFAESGTIKVTTYNDKVIAGTFEFEAANTLGEKKQITEGKFSISLVAPAGPTPGAGNENMSAKIDGTLTPFLAEGGLLSSPPFGKIMNIIGINDQQQLVMSIYDYKGVGTYLIDNEIAQGAYNFNLTQGNSYATEDGKVAGKIVITSATANTLKGTFEFVAPNEDYQITTKKTITDGKFDIKFTTY